VTPCSKVQRVNRVLILGPGASGKSTLARRLGEITGLRVIELDKVFWQPGLVATPRVSWVEIQQKLIGDGGWIMDGDLGPYDATEVRLRAADTIIFLDFGVIRCAWRAIRRSRERLDFWLWLGQYQVRSRPMLLKAIRTNATMAVVHVLRDPPAVSQFVLDVVRRYARRESLPVD
jgi:adenylate kinase family enzyme